MANPPPPPSKKNRPLRNGPPDGFNPRVLLIWVLIAAAIVALIMMSKQTTATTDTIKIPEVIALAEEGKIKEGVIKADPSGGSGWSEIRGEYAASTGRESQGFVARGRLTDERLEALQDTKLFKEEPAGSIWQSLLVGILPFILLFAIVYFLFIRQLRQAGRGALSFGKSKAKMLTRDRERITFKEVAGCDEAIEEVQEIVEFLKDPKKFQKIGGRIPKGALLVGPPGTGKTLLARAVAGEADVPFFSISGSDFVEMFVGVGAARVRDMFEQGRKNAPCIIFIDEIDAVGRQRGAGLGGGNDEREQTLNSLLVEMDGFDAHEGVIIMAATNRPDVLDHALLRPGRFDRQIVIDLPDIAGREAILRVHAKKIQMEKDLDFGVVARNSPGFSGADLANLLNEAALHAARKDKKVVDMYDIDEARDKISFGRERRRLLDEEDKRTVAFHEAGHALVQAVVDDGNMPIHKVTIIPRGQSLGMAMMMPKKDMVRQTQKFLENRICTGMGGRVAEELVFSDITTGAAADIKMVTGLARHMVCDYGMSNLGPLAYGENQEQIFLAKEITRTQNYSEQTAQRIDSAIREIVDQQYQRARAILSEKKDKLEKIAQALLEYETIEGKHVQEILEHGEIRSPIYSPPEQKPNDDDGSKAPEATEEAKRQEPLGPGTEPALA